MYNTLENITFKSYNITKYIKSNNNTINKFTAKQILYLKKVKKFK